jgi:hypothetical protein
LRLAVGGFSTWVHLLELGILGTVSWLANQLGKLKNHPQQASNGKTIEPKVGHIPHGRKRKKPTNSE